MYLSSCSPAPGTLASIFTSLMEVKAIVSTWVAWPAKSDSPSLKHCGRMEGRCGMPCNVVGRVGITKSLTYVWGMV